MPNEGAEPGPFPPFTMAQFWKMCDAQMSDPVVLGRADLTKPFVYDRRYGVFYVPMGHHQTAMSLLLAFDHGCRDGLTVANKLGLRYSHGTADHWLETVPGTAFRSSQGTAVRAGRRESLNVLERRFFGEVVYNLKDRN